MKFFSKRIASLLYGACVVASCGVTVIDASSSKTKVSTTAVKQFCQSLLEGEIEKVKAFVDSQTPEGFRDIVESAYRHGPTVLHYAAESGQEEMINLLLDAMGSGFRNYILKPDSDGNLPIHKAAQAANGAAFIRILVSYLTAPERARQLGYNDPALARRDLKDMMKRVNGHDSSNHNTRKRALVLALESKNDTSARALLEAFQELYPDKGEGIWMQVVEENTVWSGVTTSLHLAAKHNLIETVKFIVGLGDNKLRTPGGGNFLWAADQQGMTALRYATCAKHVEIVNILLMKLDMRSDKNLKILMQPAGRKKRTVIHDVGVTGSAKILESFLKKLGKKEFFKEAAKKDKDGKTMLHLAVDNKIYSEAFVRTLVATLGAKHFQALVLIEDNEGETVLDYLAKGDNRVVSSILAILNSRELEDLQKQFVALADSKVRRSIQTIDLNGMTALHRAAAAGDIATLSKIRALLGVSFVSVAEIADRYGNTPLHLAVDKGYRDFVENFFEWLDMSDIHQLLQKRNVRGYTPLHLAVQRKDERLVALLMKPKSDATSVQGDAFCAIAEIRDNNGFTAIDEAFLDHGGVGVRNDEDLAAIERVLAAIQNSRGAEFKKLATMTDDHGQTILHHVAAINNKDGYRRIARFLDYSEVFSDFAAKKDREGRTALHRAAMNDNDWLLDELKDAPKLGQAQFLNLLIERDNKGATFLHYAARRNNPNMISALMTHLSSRKEFFFELLGGCDEEGCTVFHYAASVGGSIFLRDVIQKIDETFGAAGAIALSRLFIRTNQLGQNMLHMAACMEHHDLIGEVMLRMKHPKGFVENLIEHPDLVGRTVLHVAAIAGSVEALRAICLQYKNKKERFNALVMMKDREGKTALECAFCEGNDSAFNLLARLLGDRAQRTLLPAPAKSSRRKRVTNLVHRISAKRDFRERDENTVKTYFKILKEQGVKPRQVLRQQDQNGWTPIISSVNYDNGRLIKLCMNLLKGSAQKKVVSIRDDEGRSALDHAMSQGSGEVVEALIGGMASQARGELGRQKTAHDKYSPLHYAAKNGNVEAIRAYAKQYHPEEFYDLCTSTDADKVTPIHLAAQEGHLDVIRAIAAILGHERLHSLCKATTRYHYTPIHLAAMKGHAGVVSELSGMICETKFCAVALLESVDGHTALDVAAHYGHYGVVKAILELWSSEISADALLPHLVSALCEAACTGSQGVIKEIYAYLPIALDGAVVNRCGTICEEDTSGSEYCDIDCAYCVALKALSRVLQKRHNRGDVCTGFKALLRESRTTWLLATIKNGHCEGFGALLACMKYDDLVWASTETRRTLLHEIAQYGQPRMLDHLNKAILTQLAHLPGSQRIEKRDKFLLVKDHFGNTALHIAARPKCAVFKKLANMLPDDGRRAASVAHPNNQQQTPLHCAARRGSVGVVNKILGIFDVRDSGPRQRNFAAQRRQLILRQDQEGNTALHLAVKHGRGDVVKSLSKRGISFEELLRQANNEQSTPLHIAGERKNNMMSKLCDNLAQSEASTARENKAQKLTNAERKTLIELLKLRNSAQRTVMHVAASSGNEECIEQILRAGGQGSVKLLVSNSKQARTHKDAMGRTPLYLAAREGRSDTITLLLKDRSENECKRMVMAETNDGRLPIHTASKNGKNKCIPILLESFEQSDRELLKAEDREGKTPYHHAVENGHVTSMQALQAGKPIEEIREYLVKNDKNGNNPLHSAVKEGKAEAIKEFISILNGGESGSQHINLLREQNGNSETPLHVAVRRGKAGDTLKSLLTGLNPQEVTKLLCEDVNNNSLKMTLLHTAAEHNKPQVIKVIFDQIRKQIDELARGQIGGRDQIEHKIRSKLLKLLSLCNNAGITALHEAAREGHVKVLHMINELIEPVDFKKIAILSSEGKQSILYTAVENQRWEFVEALYELLGAVSFRSMVNHSLLNLARDMRAGHRIVSLLTGNVLVVDDSDDDD